MCTDLSIFRNPRCIPGNFMEEEWYLPLPPLPFIPLHSDGLHSLFSPSFSYFYLYFLYFKSFIFIFYLISLGACMYPLRNYPNGTWGCEKTYSRQETYTPIGCVLNNIGYRSLCLRTPGNFWHEMAKSKEGIIDMRKGG